MKKWTKLPKAKQQMLVLIGILTVIGLAIMWLLWISDNLTAFSNSKSKIKQLEAQVTELEGKAKLDVRNQPMLEQIVAFVRPLGDTMLTGDAYMWAVREIRRREEKSPIKVVGIRPGAISAHPRRTGYQVYSAQIDLEGTYDQIGVFVRDFENDFITSEIRRLELIPLEETNPIRRASLQVAFLVYPDGKWGPRTAKETAK